MSVKLKSQEREKILRSSFVLLCNPNKEWSQRNIYYITTADLKIGKDSKFKLAHIKNEEVQEEDEQDYVRKQLKLLFSSCVLPDCLTFNNHIICPVRWDYIDFLPSSF